MHPLYRTAALLVVLVLTPLDVQVAFGVRSRPSLDLDHGAYVGSGEP